MPYAFRTNGQRVGCYRYPSMVCNGLQPQASQSMLHGEPSSTFKPGGSPLISSSTTSNRHSKGEAVHTSTRPSRASSPSGVSLQKYGMQSGYANLYPEEMPLARNASPTTDGFVDQPELSRVSQSRAAPHRLCSAARPLPICCCGLPPASPPPPPASLCVYLLLPLLLPLLPPSWYCCPPLPSAPCMHAARHCRRHCCHLYFRRPYCSSTGTV